MGEIAVPQDALYGAQTARALDNFPISGTGIGREMIRALGLIKKAAAVVNADLGRLDLELAGPIGEAASEVARGEHDDHFPVDSFQTGSGTSSNMNANEVIANRAIALLGGRLGAKSPVHPNDHVNMGQSSNDVFPTAIHIAALAGIERGLLPALGRLNQALLSKSEQFRDVLKIGRTHLQDAVPMRLGQEFSGYVAQVQHSIQHLMEVSRGLRELAIGGTALGTGLNTPAEFAPRVIEQLNDMTGGRFVEASNHFEAQSARDAVVRVSGALKSLAVSLIKISNDIRWLGSGPRLGLGELILPATQPGSSIMPGKVNPVIAEALIQVGAQVIGNDAAIAVGGTLSQLQLNTMQPLIAKNLLEQIGLLTNGVTVFTDKLVAGLEPNREHLAAQVERSLGMATALAPHIGYEKAAEIAKLADRQNKTVREVARELGVLPEEELARVLDPNRQTGHH